MTVAVEPKVHPILFSGPMVRAILDGRKSVTRRVIKPQPFGPTKYHTGISKFFDKGEGRWWGVTADIHRFDPSPATLFDIRCPYGAAGDLLWCRETWADLRGMGFDTDVAYRAQYLNRHGAEDADSQQRREEYGVPWKPSIHMPKRYARLWLRVTDIRVERLQDISEDDAIAEGSQVPLDEIHPRPQAALSERHAFANLWDTLNAGRGFGWETNPYVWCISFERTEAPHD